MKTWILTPFTIGVFNCPNVKDVAVSECNPLMDAYTSLGIEDSKLDQSIKIQHKILKNLLESLTAVQRSA